MLAVKTGNGNLALIEAIEGRIVATGSAGAATAADPTFDDATSGAFTNVEVGDQLYISGYMEPFTVSTKTSDNSLELSLPISATGSALHWKAKRNGIGIENLRWDPVRDGRDPNQWTVFYEVASFYVVAPV